MERGLTSFSRSCIMEGRIERTPTIILTAHQADGSSPLTIVGETTISLARKNNTFQFCGLVVHNLDVEMLAGTPFMEINDITIRPAKRIITLADGTTYTYGTTQRALNRHAVRRAHVLRAPPTNTTVWPGDFDEKKEVTPMANVDNDVTPSFRVTLSCILIVSLWLVVVLCPPINVLKLPTLTSVYLCE